MKREESVLKREEWLDLLLLEADHGLEPDEAKEFAGYLTTHPEEAAVRSAWRSDWRHLREWCVPLAMPRGHGEQGLRAFLREPRGMFITRMISLAAALLVGVALVYGVSGPIPVGWLVAVAGDGSLPVRRTLDERPVTAGQLVTPEASGRWFLETPGVSVELDGATVEVASEHEFTLCGDAGEIVADVHRRVEFRLGAERLISRGALLEVGWRSGVETDTQEWSVVVRSGAVVRTSTEELWTAASGTRRFVTPSPSPSRAPNTDDSPDRAPEVRTRRDLNPPPDPAEARGQPELPTPRKDYAKAPAELLPGVRGSLLQQGQPLTQAAQIMVRRVAVPSFLEPTLFAAAAEEALQRALCLDRSSESATTEEWTLESDPSGDFEFVPDACGWYEILVQPQESFVADQHFGLQVRPPLGRLVQWSLPEGMTLRGRVLDVFRKAVPECWVQADGRSAFSDDQGWYALEHVEACGGIGLRLEHQGHAPMFQTVDREERPVHVLQRTVVVHGQLTGPIPTGSSPRVTARWLAGPSRFRRDSCCEEGGRFTLAELPADTPILFRVEPGQWAAVEWVQTLSGETDLESVELEIGRNCSLVARDAAGKPVKNVQVFAGGEAMGRTDRSGVLALEGIADSVELPLALITSSRIRTLSAPWESQTLEVEMGAAAGSSVRVCDRQGVSIEDAYGLLVLYQCGESERWIAALPIPSPAAGILEIPRLELEDGSTAVCLYVGAPGCEIRHLEDLGQDTEVELSSESF